MPADFISRKEACQLLGVKAQTLYAYVSRGLIRTADAGLYARADVLSLKARSRARAGHGAVAAGAMRWGEPVLESAVTRLGEDDVYYRGLPLRQLLQRNVRFERAAELIWSGVLPGDEVTWKPVAAKSFMPPAALSYAELSVALAGAGAADPGETLDDTLANARAFLVGVVKHLGPKPQAASFAALLATRLGIMGEPWQLDLLNAALIASADFELSASTFAARIAASTGAGIHACLQAGLAAFSGNVHGAQVDRAEAQVTALLAGHVHVTDDLPGFGQKLYPKGDPRARALMDQLLAAEGQLPARRAVEWRELVALTDSLQKETRLAPNLEWTLALLGRVLALKSGSTFGIFALGRMVGWVAHVVEQRQQGYLLRPRAKYTGR